MFHWNTIKKLFPSIQINAAWKCSVTHLVKFINVNFSQPKQNFNANNSKQTTAIFNLFANKFQWKDKKRWEKQAELVHVVGQPVDEMRDSGVNTWVSWASTTDSYMHKKMYSLNLSLSFLYKSFKLFIVIIIILNLPQLTIPHWYFSPVVVEQTIGPPESPTAKTIVF